MRTWIAMGLALLFSACDGLLSPGEFAAEDSVLRWGTSFGECLGYCVEELEIDGLAARLTRRGWNLSELPTQVYSRQLTEADRQELLEAADGVRIGDFNDIYGCPDCADGGAEWVEMEREGSRKRVTFEYSNSPDGLDRLVAEVRAIRERFPQP